jgi:hypothetical protein
MVYRNDSGLYISGGINNTCIAMNSLTHWHE